MAGLPSTLVMSSISTAPRPANSPQQPTSRAGTHPQDRGPSRARLAAERQRR